MKRNFTFRKITHGNFQKGDSTVFLTKFMTLLTIKHSKNKCIRAAIVTGPGDNFEKIQVLDSDLKPHSDFVNYKWSYDE